MFGLSCSCSGAGAWARLATSRVSRYAIASVRAGAANHCKRLSIQEQTSIGLPQTNIVPGQSNIASGQTNIVSRQSNIGSGQTNIVPRQTNRVSRQTNIGLRQSNIGSRQTNRVLPGKSTASRPISLQNYRHSPVPAGKHAFAPQSAHPAEA